jgi:tetratricopeptide (TPR) repeat protein
MIVNDPTVQTFNFTEIITNWFRPVRTLSLTIDYLLWGLNPAGYHLTNILIHSVNSFLVFVLALKIAGDARTSLLAALLFAVHPIQTDAVTYISGRRDILFTLFYLLSFYSYIRFREENRWRLAATSLIAFVLSLLTKEMAVTLPVVLLLWEVYTRWETEMNLSVARQLMQRIWETAKARKWELIVGGVMATGIVARYVIGEGKGMGSARASKMEYWGGNFWTNFLTVATVHVHQLKQIIAPVTLVASYQGAFPIAQSLFEWRVMLSLAILLGIFSVGFYCLKRDKLISFAIAFYFITLLPVSHIIPHHELLAEHYLYLPMFGFSLLIGHFMSRLAQRSPAWKKIAYVSFGLIVILLSARTVVRNHDWKDAFTLWSVTHQAVPTSPRAAYNLGVEYERRQDYDRAIACFQKTIELDPNHTPAYNNLAGAYMTQGKFAEALKIYQRALMIRDRPSDPALWGRSRRLYAIIRRNTAKAYLHLGQPENALREAKQAINVLPIDPASYLLLGEIHQAQNQVEAAIKAYREGLRRVRSDAANELRLALAGLYARNHRWDEAIKEWQTVLQSQPRNPAANVSLAVYFLAKEDSQKSAQYLRSASANPLPDDQLKEILQQAAAPYPPLQSYALIAETYQNLNRYDRAIAACQEGLSQYPTDRTLRLKLAFLYAATKDLEKAAAEWQTVIKTYPDDFLANYNLGAYHLTKGDKATADRHLNIALANASDEAQRQQVQAIIEQMKQGHQHSHAGS